MLREVAAPHANSIQKPFKSLDCLPGEVTQPSENRLTETTTIAVLTERPADLENVGVEAIHRKTAM